MELSLKAQEIASELIVLAAMSARQLGEWNVITQTKKRMAGTDEYSNRRAETNFK